MAVAVAAVTALLGLPAAASAAPAIGIAEQNVALFQSPHWAQLGLRHVRYTAAWDALRHPGQRAQTDAWLAAAQASGARVLLGFGHSWQPGRERALPSPRAFEREFRRFRARYPLITDWLVWNEANHSSQPTWRRPDRAAAYFDVVAANCRGCRIVAADVLDWRNMGSWLQAFRRRARHRPRIWGLHNYTDANRFQTDGTRELLRTVRGEVWFTETGGLVERRQVVRGVTKVWRHSPQRAARAMRWVQRLAALSRRVRRVYVYHWQPGPPSNRWDSALLDRRGRPRPSYEVVRRWARQAAAARRR